MQRPVMNPLFAGEDEAPARSARRSLLSRLRAAAAGAARLLLIDVRFWRRKPALRVEVGTRLGRIAQALLYRMAFLPVALVLVLAALYWIGTHPPRFEAAGDPQSHGVYYDPVVFSSADGTPLEGWLVPLLDPRRIVADGERALRLRYPAVILIHDHGRSRAQMLPLVHPLHDAGFVVLAINLRGAGASTFGLKESRDVAAAIEMLRRRPFIDPSRIALLGVGTGGSAAILAAAGDQQVAALVLDKPLRNADDGVANYLSPRQEWLAWCRPLCRWTFEIAAGVNANDLQKAADAVLRARPVLVFDQHSANPTCFSRRGTQVTIEFLQSRLHPPTSGQDQITTTSGD